MIAYANYVKEQKSEALAVVPNDPAPILFRPEKEIFRCYCLQCMEFGARR